MKRTYDYRKLKGNRPYTVESLAILFSVEKATVRGWIKRHGLSCAVVDAKRPLVMKGALIREWMKEWQAKRKWSCGDGEMPCIGCGGPRKLKLGTFKINPSNTLKITAQGECDECGKTIYRFDVKANQEALERQFTQYIPHHHEAPTEHISKGTMPRNDIVQKGKEDE